MTSTCRCHSCHSVTENSFLSGDTRHAVKNDFLSQNKCFSVDSRTWLGNDLLTDLSHFYLDLMFSLMERLSCLVSSTPVLRTCIVNTPRLVSCCSDHTTVFNFYIINLCYVTLLGVFVMLLWSIFSSQNIVP